MWRLWLLHRLLPMALCSGLLPLAAQAAPDLDARAWLARMKSAAQSGNFQGTLVLSAGGVMSGSRVWHYTVGDNVYERLEAQDGRQQRIFRHNEEVRTVWPQTRTAIVEKRQPLATWSTTPQAVDVQAADNYDIRREGSGRVAGREAAVLSFVPRDALRFAQRLWADLATGLMLRADVLAADGSPIESSAFSAIEIGVRPQPEQVVQPMRNDEGLRVLRPQQRRTTLEAEKWALAKPVPGYTLVGSVVRGVDPGADEPSMMQVVFTDGLTHVSVFVERYAAERHKNEMQAKVGATNTTMRRSGEHWITVVGDVPAAALKQFFEALEPRR